MKKYLKFIALAMFDGLMIYIFFRGVLSITYPVFHKIDPVIRATQIQSIEYYTNSPGTEITNMIIISSVFYQPTNN